MKKKINNMEDTTAAALLFIEKHNARLADFGEYKDSLAHEVYVEIIKKHPEDFALVPKKHRAEDLALIAFEGGFDDLSKVPLKNRTYRVCLSAIRANTKNIDSVPKTCRVYPVYFVLVQHAEETLDKVPMHMRKIEICKEAMKYCSANFKHVPSNLINEDMCISAIRDEKTREDMLKLIPIQFMGGLRFIRAHRKFDSIKFGKERKAVGQNLAEALRVYKEKRENDEPALPQDETEEENSL